MVRHKTYRAGSVVKNLPAIQKTQKTWVPSLHREDYHVYIHGNSLQDSCLGNPMDRGAWWATVHEIARVGHDLVTKPNQANLCILSPFCIPFTDSSLSERPQRPSIKAQEGSSPGANQHLYVIPLEVAISSLWMMKRVPVNILLQAPLSMEFQTACSSFVISKE